MYKVYLILFTVFGLIIILAYLFNFNVIFKLNLNFLGFIGQNNFILFLIVNYMVKLPILFVYSKTHNLLEYYNNKNVSHDTIFITILYIILNTPIFVLNEAFEVLVVYRNERLLFQRKYLLHTIYSTINHHILINILFFNLSICSKKIILKDGVIRLSG